MTSGVRIEPLGIYLLVEQSGDEIVRISFSAVPPDEPSDLARSIVDYLLGDAPCPDVLLRISGITDFQKKVFAVVREIPRGRTMTYGDVALLAGKPGAARAVGRAMALNPFAILVPCHRVVSRDGLGGFAWGLELKEKLLSLERIQT
ncbi:MAG: Methylated-DNA--protein-cysteine methyltransferase [Methanosaeta sp. PtaB.Bin018]|jgi:methylated-DNA-[protein]-cysteine S-methyltransferase|nr:MGMT family protein [Methanothrix sp.]OPX75932.1 MAG: Methylated-DNA--protein-cysteine methyltransferase [Methanosaeta sp. PtaB.Bin018]OPY44946.1 MAG: Methylated-DNA--protein-cysteine methyltransferase [Methanosaeta sp. PtaU1.Bin016]